MSSAKFIFLIIFLINFSQVYNGYGDTCDNIKNPSDKEECFDAISETEKDLNYKCCYRTEKKNDNTLIRCEFISDEDYNELDSYKKEEMELNQLTDLEIECSQNFINISMFVFFVLFIINFY